MVSKTAFGALPIQRVDMQTAKSILKNAYDAGINFFDTARAYTDSEEKLGATFGGGLRGISSSPPRPCPPTTRARKKISRRLCAT